jgi:pimeloyl-ACP methyl ester carboxylesterase
MPLVTPRCRASPWVACVAFSSADSLLYQPRRHAHRLCDLWHGTPLIWVAHFIHHLKFDWDSPVWGPWISALAKRHKLIRYDFRGTGLSDRAGAEFTFEKLVEDFEAVVSASGADSFALFAMSPRH